MQHRDLDIQRDAHVILYSVQGTENKVEYTDCMSGRGEKTVIPYLGVPRRQDKQLGLTTEPSAEALGAQRVTHWHCQVPLEDTSQVRKSRIFPHENYSMILGSLRCVSGKGQACELPEQGRTNPASKASTQLDPEDRARGQLMGKSKCQTGKRGKTQVCFPHHSPFSAPFTLLGRNKGVTPQQEY